MVKKIKIIGLTLAFIGSLLWGILTGGSAEAATGNRVTNTTAWAYSWVDVFTGRGCTGTTKRLTSGQSDSYYRWNSVRMQYSGDVLQRSSTGVAEAAWSWGRGCHSLYTTGKRYEINLNKDLIY